VTAERLRELGVDPTVPGRYLIEDAIGELLKKAEDRTTETSLQRIPSKPSEFE
jgi:hypothetical protein